MFITCGYDEERRREDRKNEIWIPLAKLADGIEPTRQQVLEGGKKAHRKQWNPVDARWDHVQDQSSDRKRRRRMETNFVQTSTARYQFRG